MTRARGRAAAALLGLLRVAREYQRTAFRRWIANDMRGVVSLPTGAGKTLVGVAAVAYALARGLEPVLILVPTRVIGEQWLRRLRELLGEDVAAWADEGKPAPVLVATYARASMKPELVEHANLVVVDEVHHFKRGWGRLLRLLQDKHVLGLTAESPEELYETGVAQTLGGVVYARSLEELAGRYLPVPLVETVEYPGSNVNQPPAELVAEVVQRLLSSNSRKVIVFANTVSKAREIAEKLRELGIDVWEAYGQEYMSPKRLVENIREFAAAPSGVLVGTTVLDEGVDIPAVDVAVIATPSVTNIRTIQRIGRALRAAPGKYAARIVFIVPMFNRRVKEFVRYIASRLAEVTAPHEAQEMLARLSKVERRLAERIAESYPEELAELLARLTAAGDGKELARLLSDYKTRVALQEYLYHYYLSKTGDAARALRSWRQDVRTQARVARTLLTWLLRPDRYDYPGVDAGDAESIWLAEKVTMPRIQREYGGAALPA